MSNDAVSTWLNDKLPQMEEHLRALVEVNSFTDNPEGGRKVAELLGTLFAMPGMLTKTVRSEKFADHLVFHTEGRSGAAPIAMIGHLDTVFPPGKFEGYKVDGRLRRGPGVLDMKGGLVVIAFALKALAENGGLSRLPPLRIVVVSDEEVGSPEGQGVIRAHLDGASHALVFESGRANDAIITRRKGTGAVNVVSLGKAAHAGNAHQEGINAIWAMARFVDRVQGLTDYGRGITVNVGKVVGGQGKNTVPDKCEAFVDLRFEKRSDGEMLVKNFHEAADGASKEVKGARFELSGGIAREPLERSDASVELMNRYGEHAKACGLNFSESPLVGGGSDASTSSSMGIPSIDGLGPRGKGFHTVDEHIEVDTLIPKTQALARFLATL
jgi:glutamate carboxypeptidase